MYCQEFGILDYTWLTCKGGGGRVWWTWTGWGKKRKNMWSPKNCQLSWRQIENKCINIYRWHIPKCGASSPQWGIWFHAAVIHFHLECSRRGRTGLADQDQWTVSCLQMSAVFWLESASNWCPNIHPGDVWRSQWHLKSTQVLRKKMKIN